MIGCLGSIGAAVHAIAGQGCTGLVNQTSATLGPQPIAVAADHQDMVVVQRPVCAGGGR
jgi:hypothetical protein